MLLRSDTGGYDERAARADATDGWLRELWRPVVRGAGPDPSAGQDGSEGLALAAVGSLARREAGPHSDLDLVLLYDDALHPPEAIAAVADRLWYPIWDCGRRLDHSVRSVAECRAVAESDLPATVGLLDLRLIDGDPRVLDEARTLVGQDWRAAARRRLPEVVEAVRRRHDRFGELAQLVEPDLKECRGGIRDMAITRAMTSAWLADRPHGDVDVAYELLLDVRDAVHEVTGRGRDRLVRQDVPVVAELLGYAGSDDFRRALGDAARELALALDRTVRRAGQAQRARTPSTGPRGPRLSAIGYGVFESDGEVVLARRGRGAAGRPDPLLGLRAARAAARHDLPLSPTAVAAVAASADEPGGGVSAPWPEEARRLFTEFLAAGPGVIDVWESLSVAGVIQRWIPAWAPVRSLPQVSPLHRHTVDRHQLETVVQAGPLLDRVRRPDLLVVAALLHDLGKGHLVRGERAGGDPNDTGRGIGGPLDAGRGGPDASDAHAELGAPIAASVAADLGFGPDDVAVIERLVREHLTLARLATTRDPADPATIDALLAAVDSDPEQLELLAALTEADARAAGDRAWTASRATLIAQLTRTARRLLARSVTVPRVLTDSPRVPDGLRETVVARGAQATIRRSTRRGAGATVVTAAVDRPRLFGDLAGVLSVAGWTVDAAELTTLDGLAYDTWLVRPRDGRDAPRVDETSLSRSLRRLEAGDRSVLRSLPSSDLVVDRVEWLPTWTRPSDEPASSVLRLHAADAPGLLHRVGSALAGAGISIRRAEIVTLAGRCIDTFALTTTRGGMLGDPHRTAVEHALTPGRPAGPGARASRG